MISYAHRANRLLTGAHRVKSNQMSPLLRLPPEIRNKIWQYVLGGKLIRVEDQKGSRYAKFSSSPSEPDNAMALLRTCRQVYAEAALMPLLLNTFSFDYITVVKKLKLRQRKHIASIRFNLSSSLLFMLHATTLASHQISLPTLFPCLKKICVRIFGVPTSEDGAAQERERRVRREFELSNQGFQVDLHVEETDISWYTFDTA